jgi:hypothetical protein
MKKGLISAVDLARRARVTAKRFRQWLRHEARRGNQLVADHQRYGRWWFTEVEAHKLLTQFSIER